MRVAVALAGTATVAVLVGTGVRVAVAVGCTVLVAVSAGRGVRVAVDEGTGVLVGCCVYVAVAVAVFVLLGGTVGVGVPVLVLVGGCVLVAVPVGVFVGVALGAEPQLALSTVTLSCQAYNLPSSYWPPSLTSSVHVPCACCPTKDARLASSGL